MSGSRLLVVSNRLPLNAEEENGVVALVPSSGGLVTALLPVLRANGGCWIGWTGRCSSKPMSEALQRCAAPNYRFEPVSLSEEEKTRYYEGCCNQIIWPLFHGMASRCDFDPAFWEAYCAVNRKFADAVARTWRGDDFIWVHDYHLMLVAASLGRQGGQPKLAYFQHIPFPPPDIFAKLPWRAEILRALLQFSTIGFQTVGDRRNFTACVRQFLGNVHFRSLAGKILVTGDGKTGLVGSYPVGIDFDEFADQAADSRVAGRAEQIRAGFRGCQIILGVDRLDYTKGIPERLRAFRSLLKAHPELHRKVALLQIAVPSREEVPEYRELRLRIERQVSEINGHFGSPTWMPIHYIHRAVARNELLACYRAADVALVTPLKDGMNLVAKEYCASRVDEDGVLVLSEFAGAADQLRRGALVVNPHDENGVTGALLRALTMRREERQSRMRLLREIVREKNVFRWCDSFCRQLPYTALPKYYEAKACESAVVSRSA